jgi:hypothetical protein
MTTIAASADQNSGEANMRPILCAAHREEN